MNVCTYMCVYVFVAMCACIHVNLFIYVCVVYVVHNLFSRSPGKTSSVLLYANMGVDIKKKCL